MNYVVPLALSAVAGALVAHASDLSARAAAKKAIAKPAAQPTFASAGNTIIARIPENKNDPFDRQRCIADWKQDQIEQQVCLCLGVGGLGCTIAIMLARLGVKKIILIDKDNVETSNLNRQILFTKADVGRRKVDAAADNIKSHLIGNTEVIPLNMDVTTHWGEVVDLAKKSTVIFNNIDIGIFFDFATISLAKSLEIPYVAGSSYSSTWIVEYFTGNKEESSFSYAYPEGPKEVFDKLVPTLIQDYKELTFLPRDNNPPTRTIGSSCLVCCSAGIMTVNAWIQSMMGNTMPNYTKFEITHFWEKDDVVGWPPPPC